jgi:hypothetical protein
LVGLGVAAAGYQGEQRPEPFAVSVARPHPSS